MPNSEDGDEKVQGLKLPFHLTTLVEAWQRSALTSSKQATGMLPLKLKRTNVGLFLSSNWRDWIPFGLNLLFTKCADVPLANRPFAASDHVVG